MRVELSIQHTIQAISFTRSLNIQIITIFLSKYKYDCKYLYCTVERFEETPHGRTYEEPIQVYSPNSDSFYSSLGNASTIRSFKNTTFPSTAGESILTDAFKM